jgi:hypothetical protein
LNDTIIYKFRGINTTPKKGKKIPLIMKWAESNLLNQLDKPLYSEEEIFEMEKQNLNVFAHKDYSLQKIKPFNINQKLDRIISSFLKYATKLFCFNIIQIVIGLL